MENPNNLEGLVQREDRSITSRLREAASSIILGAALRMGAGYSNYRIPDRRTYQGQELDINSMTPPTDPPQIYGGETTSPGIGGETHESPRYSLHDIIPAADLGTRFPPWITERNYLPVDISDEQFAQLLEEHIRSVRPLEQYINARPGTVTVGRDRDVPQNYSPRLHEFDFVLNNSVPTTWRPQLPSMCPWDVEYLAAGDQKTTEKPAVSVAETPVTFWKGPLQNQHGTVECEYFGGVRSMMRVKLQKPLSFEEFAAKIPLESRAKEAWDNAVKSSYVQDDKLAYFTVPWSELIIDASPEYLESRKVRAEIKIGKLTCSGTVHSIRHSSQLAYEPKKDKYVIELDEPVKGPDGKNYTILAVSKKGVRPIRADTEKYIEMTVKGNPENGCTLKHEDMEIS